jgi:hypothetical protein
MSISWIQPSYQYIMELSHSYAGTITYYFPFQDVYNSIQIVPLSCLSRIVGTRLSMSLQPVPRNQCTGYRVIKICRSYRPRGLRHDLVSLARTLGSWVRISLKVWMSVLCALNLCLCCSVCRQRPSDGLIPIQAVLQIVYRNKKSKRRQRPNKGL